MAIKYQKKRIRHCTKCFRDKEIVFEYEADSEQQITDMDTCYGCEYCENK